MSVLLTRGKTVDTETKQILKIIWKMTVLKSIGSLRIQKNVQKGDVALMTAFLMLIGALRKEVKRGN